LTLKRSLSDAEWDALTKKLFIAWEETGVRVTQLEASADHVRKRVNRPSTRESTDALLGKQPRSGPRHIKGPTDS
jgi:hypothetical protein